MNLQAFSTALDGAGFQLCTVLVCVSCLYYTFVHNRPEKLHNRIYVVMLCNILVTALCSLLTSMVKPYVLTSEAAFSVQSVTQFIYFILHPNLAPMFCFYVAIVTGADKKLKKNMRYLYEFPMYVMLLMGLINPFTGWIYYFTPQREYHRGWALLLFYGIAAMYFIFAMIVLLFLWKSISRQVRLVMIYFFSMVTLGTLTQLFLEASHTELFTEALAMTGIMITIENEVNRKDSRTGILNHAAFAEDVKKVLGIGNPFSILCLKMHNPLNLMQLIGPANIELLTKMTSEYLVTQVSKHDIYYVGPGSFVILFEDTPEEETVEVARNIQERFRSGWDFQGRINHFDSSVFLAQIPRDLSGMQEIMTLVHASLPKNFPVERDSSFTASLNFVLRQNRMEKTILNGLKSRSFEVFYQPIYRAKNLAICSGEALLRLHDEEIGELYPGDFLPIAERGGLIFELGDFVLEEVCKFLNSGIPQEMGIETLSVNLSVVQCIQLHYADRIIGIISKYNVDPSRITFEIMESAAATDFNALKDFVDTLLAFGCHFTVNDYGIGYSNIHSIFHLDIDCVKIDKTILREAANTKTGQIILDSSISMIKKMNKKIIISGVENQDQIEMAENAGIDYLQGFYFSNPVSQNEFINVLRATRLAKMEEQKAIASNEAMSSFLANMSHEIRTPINAVLGMDEMILRESNDTRIIEYAKTIEGAGRTLLSLINDILDFSKIESGKMEIASHPYSLSRALTDLISMMRIRAEKKKLNLITDIDPSVYDRLIGDELRLKQVLLNLLSNAIKYTEKGSISLSVGYKQISDDGILLILSVKDTGIGIKPEDLDTLFDKFKRLDIDKNKTVEGTGLGLTITRQILSLMDGKIEVSSTYGKGSTFTVTLPQGFESSARVGTLSADPAESSGEEESLELRAPEASILIVDDTKVNRVVVRSLLEFTGAGIDEAESGKECLTKVEENAYDLIFLDYRMPEMDGIETIQNMKKLSYNKSANAAVIALTANAVAGARERFLQEGFDDYITKPVSGKKLLRLLKMYLPPEKILQYTEKSVTKSEKTGNIEQVDRFAAERRAGINPEMGIRNCESEALYATVLDTFLEDLTERRMVLEDCYEKMDLPNYQTYVHAMKSSSRVIGADTLSALAGQLELAAEEKDVACIRENHPSLLDEIRKLEELRQMKNQNNPGEYEEDLPALSEDKWKDALNTIRELSESMDSESVQYVLKDLSKYQLTGEQKTLYEQMKKLAKELEWQKLREI